MLAHPTLDRLHAMGLTGMAKAFNELTANAEAEQLSHAEWLALLPQNDIPAVRLHSLESLMDDPHLEAVGYFKTVQHASEGAVVSMAIPGRWSESRPEVRRDAPRLGEHTAQILAEAGYGEEQLSRLQAAGAIVMAPTLEGNP